MEHLDSILAGPSSATKHWESSQASGSARQHNGDVYNVTHNHTSSGGKEPDEEEEERRERDWRRSLLGWLTFAEISDRREQVREAHRETYRWIFEDDHNTGFADWLSNGRGIFWIYGKPGSGKSTLMKFIAEEPRLKTLLQGWVNGDPLVVSSFWFWALGTELQRSLIGLYRTLLYQMLISNKSLCRIAFPEWQEKFGSQEPTLEMLTHAMKKVVANTTAAPCFFLMIDGLDEYEADSIGKAGLADLVQDMARSSMVKLLVSSRPEGPFQHCFRHSPKLRLENLTRPDIVKYVEGELRSNPSVRNIRGAEKDTVDEIAREIIAGANGVFLWVVLVLRIAIDGINSYDDLGDLRRRIMLLPSQLNDLFTHIMTRRIPDRHRSEASRYLLIALESHASNDRDRRFDITSTLVAIAQQASSYEKACYFANLSFKDIEASTIDFEGHLESRCHGLLECRYHVDDLDCTNGRVMFLHRTLFDYLRIPEIKLSLSREANSCFDVHTAIMAGIACQARRMSANEMVNEYASLAKAFIDQNTMAEQTIKKHRFELVTLFDRNLTGCLSSTHISEHWSSQLVDQRLRSESDALACVIHAGSNLYLQEAIARKYISKFGVRSSTLLHFAVPPPATKMSTEGPQLGAATLLLEYGADPCFRLQALNFRSPWDNAFGGLVAMKASHTLTDVPDPGEVHQMKEWLEAVSLLAQHAQDPRACRTVDVTVGGSTGTRSATEMLRTEILENKCCSGRSLQDCGCLRSRAWAPCTLEILRLLEPGSTTESRPLCEEKATYQMPPRKESTSFKTRLRNFKFKRQLS